MDLLSLNSPEFDSPYQFPIPCRSYGLKCIHWLHIRIAEQILTTEVVGKDLSYYFAAWPHVVHHFSGFEMMTPRRSFGSYQQIKNHSIPK